MERYISISELRKSLMDKKIRVRGTAKRKEHWKTVKVRVGDEVIPKLVDEWNGSAFKYSPETMSREEVLETYNRGYYFTSETDNKEK